MSIDPYHAVQQEIQNSLHTAGQLQSSFLRIRSMANTDSEELMWARNEVRSSLSHCRVLRLVKFMWILVQSYTRSTWSWSRGFGRECQVRILLVSFARITYRLFYRIVESTDARMFGLDEAEVQKRRRYVGHVRKEIEVRSYFQTPLPCKLFSIRAYVQLSLCVLFAIDR